ncbi:hypothetical protein B0H67DRAFT_536573 [Lasiosphaeris hirsuta]|uniref:Zn(2)-C6 fungal-type domain-containing protein n=1 Tax=Lasiosphaeris hirsuta TaxID=260670 RepID=A0AA40AF65_9PEZI|nr:hypothetical protein B0H67DRAFT_536573 [Lasiosphaeris hirsuta]
MPSDAVQPRARANRSTKSCTECRRRKQKCDQDQPCNNCKRRFPEPVCEYGPRNKRNQGAGGVAGPPNPELPTFVVSLPTQGTTNRPVPSVSTYTRKAPVPWSLRAGRRRRSGLVVKWSGIDMTTEYPVYDSDDDESSPWETIEETIPHNSDSTQIAPSYNTVPQATLPVIVSPASDRRPSTPTSVIVLNPKATYHQTPQQLWHLAGPVDGMGNLPIQATKQNAMLVHTFAKLLHHFKGSFDGDPDPDNPFVTDYVPWCIQSPLLAQTSLYISARSLGERQYIDDTSTMKLKGTAISTLNKHLQSEKWISDEALAGVVQFVSIEWFFGGPEVVQAHLRGLREMVRLRGGFSDRGVGALVTKVALVDDAVIAMSLEKSPILQRGPGFDFDYREAPHESFMARFNSPLLYGPYTFSSCIGAMDLHPTTASILDDMRFLITTVLNLGPHPSAQEIKKLQSTAMWIHDRISKLPKSLPEEPTKPAAKTPRPNTASHPKAASKTHKLPAPQLLEPELEPKPHSLLPQYPNFTSSISTTSTVADPRTHNHTITAPSTHTGPKLAPMQNHPPPPPRPSPNPDYLYTAVRLTAPLYARAIGTRQPFSAVCSPADALALLGATWRIPLSRWRGVIGVLLFALVSIVATASGAGDGRDEYLRPHAGFVKSILQIGFMQMALESWEVCRETMGRAGRLLTWLRGGGGEAEDGEDAGVGSQGGGGRVGVEEGGLESGDGR